MYCLIENGLNEKQKKAVSQLDNCVVAAGAGSGKTFVLARRYAHLVIDQNIPVEEILTLTFTNKAASEMYQRIYKTLLECESKALDGSVEKKRAKKAIKEFHKSRIQTIDSYCASIVRMSSRFYGIRPDFSVDTQLVKEQVQKDSLPFVLKHRENMALQKLLQTGNLEDISQKLFCDSYMKYFSIAQPFSTINFIKNQMDEIGKNWKLCISFMQENTDRILSLLDDGESLDEAPSFNDLSLYFESCIAYQGDKNNAFFEVVPGTEPFRKHCTLWLKKVHEVSKVKLPRKSKKESEAQARGYSYRENLLKVREHYSEVASLIVYVLNFPLMLELFPLLEEFYVLCNEKKRNNGILTFNDISSLALKTLIDYPIIRGSEKKSINKIMIDEFQDNNAMQRDMLFLLAEKEERIEKTVPQADELCSQKLFFVGDEKQSIYRFRGADVSVFRKLKDDLGGDEISLDTNYRSEPSLIASFNSLFGGYDYKIMEDASSLSKRTSLSSSVFIQEHQLNEGKIFPQFEAVYKAVNAREVKNDKGDPSVHLCLYDSSSSDNETKDGGENLSKTEVLAIFTAEKIAMLMSEKKYNPCDFSLLFRSYSKQFLYEKHLRRLGIPYSSESISDFFGDAPINDMYAILRLIEYPQDALSYGEVLKSPFVRLSSNGLMRCLLEISKDSDERIDSCLFSNEHELLLEGDDIKLYHRGLVVYNDLRKKAVDFSCAQIISELWYFLGYRFECQWNMDVALFSELYDYLFALALFVDQSGGGLTTLVDTLGELKKSGQRLNDMDIPLERESAVQLMSIHKSKGLEFPVVFICDASASGRRDLNTEPVFFDEKNGLSCNFPIPKEVIDGKSNWFYTSMKNLSRQKEDAELRRLLYVAATRAEQELYISAHYSLSKDDLKKIDDEDERVDLLRILSLLVEKNADSKKNTQDKLLEPSYGISNGTLFSFLLPVLGMFLNDEKKPYSLEAIVPKTRNEISGKNNSVKKTVREIQSIAKPLYEKAHCIKKDILKPAYIAPSHLGVSSGISNGFYLRGGDSYSKIDEIIKSIPHESFGYNDFGTIAHAYAESFFTGKAVSISPTITSKLSSYQYEILTGYAKEMVENFLDDELGKRARLASWRKNEYDFKLKLTIGNNEASIMKGSIDLIFDEYTPSGKKVVVVDFKTDAREKPEEHLMQLASYKVAAASMRNVPSDDVECWLYYLRSNRAFNITKDCDSINFEKIVF